MISRSPLLKDSCCGGGGVYPPRPQGLLLRRRGVYPPLAEKPAVLLLLRRRGGYTPLVRYSAPLCGRLHFLKTTLTDMHTPYVSKLSGVGSTIYPTPARMNLWDLPWLA